MKTRSTQLFTAFILSLVAMFTIECRAKPDCSQTAFAEAKDQAEKSAAIDYWLKHAEEPACIQTFRAQIISADPSSIPLFRGAFLASADCKTLASITTDAVANALTTTDTKTYQELLKKSKLTDAPSPEDLRAIEKLQKDANERLASFSVMFTRLGEDLPSIAKRERSCLVERMTLFQDPVIPEEELIRDVLLQFLVLADENGFEAMLSKEPAKELTNERQKYFEFVTSTLPKFDQYAVIPLLKRYERGDNDDVLRLIIRLPDTEGVYQKVIEAIQHGRYVKIASKDGGLSMGDLMEASDTWWGNILESKYKNNAAFAQYLAEHMPKNPNVSLTNLSLKANPEKTFESILSRSEPPSIGELVALRGLLRNSRQLPTEERGRIFIFLYDHGLSEKDAAQSKPDEADDRNYVSRRGILSDIDRLDPDFVSTFIQSRFNRLPTDERKPMLYRAADIPSPQREQTLRALRPSCTDAEKETVDFLLTTTMRL